MEIGRQESCKNKKKKKKKEKKRKGETKERGTVYGRAMWMLAKIMHFYGKRSIFGQYRYQREKKSQVGFGRKGREIKGKL